MVVGAGSTVVVGGTLGSALGVGLGSAEVVGLGVALVGTTADVVGRVNRSVAGGVGTAPVRTGPTVTTCVRVTCVANVGMLAGVVVTGGLMADGTE